MKKPTFRENVELVLTAFHAVTTALKGAETDVRGVAQDLATLKNLGDPGPWFHSQGERA